LARGLRRAEQRGGRKREGDERRRGEGDWVVGVSVEMKRRGEREREMFWKRTGWCFVSKTPHVAFLYPGQARSCVSVVWSLEFEDWGFWLGDFECFGHREPASLTRLLPEGTDIC
jgi:hypothetical protein